MALDVKCTTLLLSEYLSKKKSVTDVQIIILKSNEVRLHSCAWCVNGEMHLSFLLQRDYFTHPQLIPY